MINGKEVVPFEAEDWEGYTGTDERNWVITTDSSLVSHRCQPSYISVKMHRFADVKSQ